MRESRVKKIVDTKASKGRKLRYHVHDKLQNFMAPVPVLRWERRRVDELFGSLLGMRTRIGEEEEEEDSEDEKERIEMPDDGLRVFG